MWVCMKSALLRHGNVREAVEPIGEAAALRKQLSSEAEKSKKAEGQLRERNQRLNLMLQ